MINLTYEPMKWAEGVIARFDSLAIGRVYRHPGDATWTVGFGGTQDRAGGFASESAGKAHLLLLCTNEEPWPSRPTFRPEI